MFKKVDDACALAKKVSCVQLPAQLTLWSHVHVTVSYKSTTESCQSTTSHQQLLYFKKQLVVRKKNTIFLKVVAYLVRSA